jgi:hypothetical protein
MPFEHYDQLFAEQILAAHWMINIPQLHEPNKEKKEHKLLYFSPEWNVASCSERTFHPLNIFV